MRFPSTPQIEQEIARVRSLTRDLLAGYVAWGPELKYGDTYQAVYGDVFDFVNFRMESVESCLTLLDDSKVSDSLALCRSLLENYMVFALICRGRKYVMVQDLTSLDTEKFKEELAKAEAAWQKSATDGTTSLIAVRKYPDANRHIEYVYDDIRFDDGEPAPVSIYYFHLDEFNPEAMRLKDEDYFEYYPMPPDVRRSDAKYRREQLARYRYILSYDSLKRSLHLNGLLDRAALLRLEAHYTFLGQYLHPTKGAMRRLRNDDNWYDGRPQIGMDRSYRQSAELLASAYVLQLAISFIEEIVNYFDAQPKRDVVFSGTTHLHELLDDAKSSTSYFWFLTNEPSEWDRYNWCVHFASKEDIESWGGYLNSPTEDIKFNKNILGNLESALRRVSNVKAGDYIPPI